jgi:hypothetical protein
MGYSRRLHITSRVTLAACVEVCSNTVLWHKLYSTDRITEALMVALALILCAVAVISDDCAIVWYSSLCLCAMSPILS